MTNTMSLVEILNELLVSEQLQLPVFPPLALEVQKMLACDDADFDEISAKIAGDQVLASQLLRLANSAFFSGLNKVSRIRDSITRLGSRQVTTLILMITQQQQYGSTDEYIHPYIDALWKHAASCAMGSKWLVERLGFSQLAEEAFIAGLVHDIGNLLLLKSAGEHQELRKTRPGTLQAGAV